MPISIHHCVTDSLIATETRNPPPTHLHIASFIAHVRPEHMCKLKDWLALSQQYEVHAEDALGKLVLVTESQYEQHILQRLDELRAQTGVLNAALVYHEQIALDELATEEPPL